MDDLISRRNVLRGGVVAVALAALPSCDRTPSPTAGPASAVTANIRVSRDQYADHVGPSLAANPRQPGQLLVACQGSPFIPEFILTYVSVDGGASWHAGGRQAQPAAGPAGDDVTVAFGGNGRGYVCAARSGHGGNGNPANPDVNRAVYVWRTDDGGRTYSAPVTLVEGIYSDHPWVAAGQDQASSGHNVYVAWGGGGDAIYVAFPTHRPGLVHSDIMVTASHDRGRTWSKPVAATLGDDVTYFQPNVAVDTVGQVAISAFALANGRMDEVLLVASPGELRFGQPLKVTAAPFNPLDSTTAFRGKYGTWWLGDWQGIAGGAGAFHLVWNDTRTGKLDLFAATVSP